MENGAYIKQKPNTTGNFRNSAHPSEHPMGAY